MPSISSMPRSVCNYFYTSCFKTTRTPGLLIFLSCKSALFQGVDLSNIIKDLSLSNTTDDITSFLKKLSECAKTAEHEHVLPLLNKLKAELDKDMARRVFAGKNGAYETLLEVISSCKDTSYILRPALKTVTSLMTGNPDLLDDAGVNLQKRLLLWSSLYLVFVIGKLLTINCF